MEHASETGVPPMRPLFVDFPDDEACWEVEDTYLFGPALLVAPVLMPGARTRSVYLPRGARWADASGNREWDGGVSIEVEAPIDFIPVFVRTDPAVDARSRALAEGALRAASGTDTGTSAGAAR